MARHITERQRESGVYGSHLPRLGWTCTLCGQWWTREPSSYCPGVHVYQSWDEASKAGLHTLTQWRAQRRLLAKGDAQPVAAMSRGPAHPSEWYWLYREDQTRPMRAAPVRTQQSEGD